MTRTTTTDNYREIERQVYEFVAAQVDNNDLTADDFCESEDVPRRTLVRALQELGTSWKAIVNEVRMERAHKLIKTTQIPIKQIAESVGYASQSQFAKAYRAKHAVAPSVTRKEARKHGHR